MWRTQIISDADKWKDLLERAGFYLYHHTSTHKKKQLYFHSCITVFLKQHCAVKILYFCVAVVDCFINSVYLFLSIKLVDAWSHPEDISPLQSNQSLVYCCLLYIRLPCGPCTLNGTQCTISLLSHFSCIKSTCWIMVVCVYDATTGKRNQFDAVGCPAVTQFTGFVVWLFFT